MEVIEFFLNPQNEEDFEVINTERGKTKTKLPFFDGEIDYRTTLIRVLEITSQESINFNPQRFSSAEQDWLVQAGFLNQEKTQFNPTAILLKKIGQELYKSLFPKGEISEDLLKAALQRANGGELHIRFCFEAESVETNRAADYPWELVHDGTKFLAWHKVSFSRYIVYNDSPPNLPQVDKVNVLLVSSKAFDPVQGLKKLGRSEREAIKKGLHLASQEGYGYVHFTDLAEESGNIPTFYALQKYLTEHRGEQQPHVLHFDGHGLYGKKCHQCGKMHAGITPQKCGDEACGEKLPPAQGYLVFEDENGQPDYISAQKLGATLQNLTPSYRNIHHGSLAVLVLSACQSGMAVAGDSVFNGTAQQLIHHSIPAVVAMQYSVSVEAAKNFAEQFYRALGQKDSLSAAVRQARIAMDIEKNQWYRPVLYLRWHDNQGGQLFSKEKLDTSVNDKQPNKKSTDRKIQQSKMTLQDLIRNGILNQLAALFNNKDMADILLDTIDFPLHMRPIFPQSGTTLGYWQGICQQIQNGALPSGNDLQPLVDAAGALYPGNDIFKKYRS